MSSTRGRAFRPSTCRTCSSASTKLMRPAAAVGPASAWRSRRRTPGCWAGRSRSGAGSAREAASSFGSSNCFGTVTCPCPGRFRGRAAWGRKKTQREALVKKLVALASFLVLSGSLGVAALFASSAPSFAVARNYPAGREPASVATGDLNGDGKPDLATANGIANTVSVLLNKGDGSFQAKLNYQTGREPASVAIGDLNGDGKPDLATANANAAGTASVLLNKGDGSFQAKLDYRTGPVPFSVAIGDLNGDGKPDLATANGVDANTVSVLANKGDGSFQARRDYRTGRSPVSVAIGDLNGDGKPDLATANFDMSTVSVLLNRGDGSFPPKLDYGTGRGPTSVAIADLNGDGKPDLATANFNLAGTVSVLLNTPGLCTVQDVWGKTLPAAKRTIVRANCRVGKIRRAYSRLKKGCVISEKPKPGTVLPNGAKVNLVVSRGRMPS